MWPRTWTSNAHGQIALTYTISVQGSTFTSRVESFFTSGANRSESTNLESELNNMSFEVTTCVSTEAIEGPLRECFEQL